MNSHSRLVAVGLAIGLAGCASDQPLGPDLQPTLQRGEAGPAWTLTDLGFPGGGSVYGYAINDAGTIGGATLATVQPFLLDASGGLTVLSPAPGSTIGQVIGLNSRNAAAGLSQPGFGTIVVATVWAPDGTVSTVPGIDLSVSSAAYDVNEAGTTVGYGTLLGSTAIHAFAWTPGKPVRDLGAAFTEPSAAGAINREGTIIGSVGGLGSPYRIVMWRPTGAPSVVKPPAGANGNVYAADLNDAGVVAGTVERLEQGGALRAFRWRQGRSELLEVPPNGLMTYATAIDGPGRVYGFYQSSVDQRLHPVVWLTNGRPVLLSEGPMGSLGPLGPGGVNRCGQVVGYTTVALDGTSSLARWDPPCGR